MIDISGQFAIQSAEQLVIMLLVMMKELNYLYHLVDFVLMKIQL